MTIVRVLAGNLTSNSCHPTPHPRLMISGSDPYLLIFIGMGRIDWSYSGTRILPFILSNAHPLSTFLSQVTDKYWGVAHALISSQGSLRTD